MLDGLLINKPKKEKKKKKVKLVHSFLSRVADALSHPRSGPTAAQLWLDM